MTTAAAAGGERFGIERNLVADLVTRGAPALAELVGTTFTPKWIEDRDLRAIAAIVQRLAREGALFTGNIPSSAVAEIASLEAQDADEGARLGEIVNTLQVSARASKPGAARAAVEALADEGANGATTTAFPLLGAADILAPQPPVRFALEALDVAPGAPTLIAGYGFSGKTLAAQDLALSWATGTPAWGHFDVTQGRVLHLDFEQGAYLTRMRYQRLARARGIEAGELEGYLSLAVMPDWYLDGDSTDGLSRVCDGFDRLIVDSFRASCPRTDENSSDARVPLDRLTRVSEQTGITPVVIHHARKPNQNAQGGSRMTIRGSGALYDACGSVLVFGGEKGAPVSVSHEKARITGRTHQDFQLWIEDVALDGDATAGLRVTYLEGEAAQPGDRFGDLKRRALDLIRAEGPVGGVNALHARLGGRKPDVSAAVDELVLADLVKRGGTYHHPTLTYAGTDHDSQ